MNEVAVPAGDARASSARAPAPACALLLEGMDIGRAIDALRNRGASRIDPVRFRFIEALARRAAAHEGATRRVLDARLAGLLSTLGEALERAKAVQVEPADAAEQEPSRRGALGELVDHVARRASTLATVHPAAANEVSPDRGSAAEPEELGYFRRTWSRLSADQRLAQSLSALPENAGPLNSHHLVHRSLAAMRELSPEYFDRFISHVDALLWLDLANEGIASESTQVPRADAHRKPARGRRG